MGIKGRSGDRLETFRIPGGKVGEVSYWEIDDPSGPSPGIVNVIDTQIREIIGRIDVGLGSYGIAITEHPLLTGVKEQRWGSTPYGDIGSERGCSLSQNRPNPFNSETFISFCSPPALGARLGIYNLAGQLVRTLIPRDVMARGCHSVVWDGKDDGGREVSSGVYVYCLTAGGFTATRKMLLLR